MNGRLARWVVVAVLLAALSAGCAQLRDIITPSAPGMTDEWAAFLNEIRAFERRIGFVDTDNFAGYGVLQARGPDQTIERGRHETARHPRENSVEFIRAYEAAVAETIRKALSDRMADAVAR